MIHSIRWRLLLAGLLLIPGPAAAQQALSHIPFCSADSAANAFVDQVRFRVAGLDSASRARQREVGLAPAAPDEVILVVDDSVCLAASAAYSRESPGANRVPAPFPVAVVRSGDRLLVRLPGERRTLVFDATLRRLGAFGTSP
ncbi:MAG TPA: hypothetical protein VLD58_08580 [Gemmatimonadales bacterium]|nr:hypothetical protein [Gemmatimonadales bacterium]